MVHRHKGILHPVISETFDVELTLLRAEECVSALFSLACSFFFASFPKGSGVHPNTWVGKVKCVAVSRE